VVKCLRFNVFGHLLPYWPPWLASSGDNSWLFWQQTSATRSMFANKWIEFHYLLTGPSLWSYSVIEHEKNINVYVTITILFMATHLSNQRTVCLRLIIDVFKNIHYMLLQKQFKYDKYSVVWGHMWYMTNSLGINITFVKYQYQMQRNNGSFHTVVDLHNPRTLPWRSTYHGDMQMILVIIGIHYTTSN
jgi:hypothetical protein